jgi:hypothetical protein
MRGVRWVVVLGTAALVVASPSGASGNGGAYFEFEKTYYLPGERAEGYSTVTIPRAKQGIFAHGPFYVYVLPGRASIEEGRAIPERAIRVGTLAIRRETASRFELEIEFTVPDVASSPYTVMTCNDPCTISGFRETLSGAIEIVETLRERSLLIEQSRLRARVAQHRRLARRAEREAQAFEGLLDANEEERDRLSEEVERLEARLAAARRPAPTPEEDRDPGAPLLPWALAGVATLSTVVAVGALRRGRKPRSASPPVMEPQWLPDSHPGPEHLPSSRDGGEKVRAG